MTRQLSVVTGVGLALTGFFGDPGLVAADRIFGGVEMSADLGGQEMRNKDRASRLALRSVDRALTDAQISPADLGLLHQARVATVVSSNYGNVDSVCEFTDVIAEQSTAGLSALGLPHVSSNVIAGWIAIRHRLRGPNLTLCSGRTSGVDALYWATNLIAARRADVVIVVGVEPDTQPVRLLLGISPEAESFDGAATVIVESAEYAADRQARVRARLGPYSRSADIVPNSAEAAADTHSMWPMWPTSVHTPHNGFSPARCRISTKQLENWSGVLSMLQCVAAVAYFDRGGPGSVQVTGGAATLQLLNPNGVSRAEPQLKQFDQEQV